MVVTRSVYPRVEKHGAHGSLTWHPLTFSYKIEVVSTLSRCDSIDSRDKKALLVH
jgi:hypothetical protein